MRIGRLWILWRPWADRSKLWRMANKMFPAGFDWEFSVGPLQLWWFEKKGPKNV